MSRDLKQVLVVLAAFVAFVALIIFLGILSARQAASPEGQRQAYAGCRRECGWKAVAAPRPEESLQLCLREMCKVPNEP